MAELRWQNPDDMRMSKARARVFFAVVALWRNQATVTVKDIADRCGHTSTATTHSHLRKLRSLGFVDWEDGERGTIHPTVAFAPVEPVR